MHSHLLPGVDDSCQSRFFFDRMLRCYAEIGFGGIVFTPHIDNPSVRTKKDRIQKTFEWASRKAEEYDLKTYLGSEYYVVDQKKIDLIPIFGKYALCETFTGTMPKDYLDVLRRVKDKGYEIIIAHIERYIWLKPDSEVMRSLVEELKVKIQVNAMGAMTKEGKRYLSLDMVDFLASDCHGDRKLVGELYRQLEKNPNVAFKMCDFFAQEIE